MSSYPDEVDEMVILVGGEDGLEELHQLGLLSDRERPGIHVDALCFQDLLEGILLRVVLELEVGDVLFHQDVCIPGGYDVHVKADDVNLESFELMVSRVDAIGRGDSDCIHCRLTACLTDVLGELSDWSADLYMFLPGPVVVFRNLQLLKDLTGLLRDEGDSGDTALLWGMVDGYNGNLLHIR